MRTITELLEAVGDDSFLHKIAESERIAMEMTDGAGGPATAPAEAASGAGSTGAISTDPTAKPIQDQLGEVSENQRIQLIDAAMEQAGAELEAQVAAARGAGTDEGHNAALIPRSGEQQFGNLMAPMDQSFQDNYQPAEEDMAGEMEVAASYEKRAAEKVAEECLAQGLFINEGFRLGLEKSAEDGTLAATLMPSVELAHEAALLKVAQSEAVDVLAQAIAEKIAQKLVGN